MILLAFLSGHALAQSYTWKSVNLQGMGYVTGLIDHPTGHQIYARTDVYGIFKWNGATNSWVSLTDNKLGAYSVESFAIDRSNVNNIYIVTGNQQSGRLYKSINQGSTWSELTNFNSKALNVRGNGPWRGAGERLAVDPNNGGNVIYFGSRQSGLWRSTDAGVTWNQIPTSSIPVGSAGGVIFVVFDPSSGNGSTNSQKIYVGVHGHGVYQSINGGSSWTLLSNGPPTTANPCRAAIANNGTLYITYASTDNNNASGFVYKYTGSGSLLNVTPATKSGEGFWGISVDRNNSNIVSTFQWNPENTNGIHRSTNGGSSWTPLGFSRPANRTEPTWYPTWSGWTWSAAMIVDPSDNKRVWLSNGFGVYRTDDINSTSPMWTAKMENLEELVVNIVSCPPVEGGADVLAGFADKQGVRVVNKDVVPSISFEQNAFGICTGIAYCEADPNFVVTVGGDQNNGADWESYAPKYRYSINNGSTWSNFTPPTTTSVNGGIAVSCTDKNRWVIAPKDRIGTFNDPHYTTNGGASWIKSTGTPENLENGCTEQWSASQFLIADKVNGNKFYYYCDRTSGSSNGGFYISSNGGASFTAANINTLPGAYKSTIVSVPGKEGHVFYCSKSSGSSLYRTMDGGFTWATIAGITNCSSIGIGKAVAGSTEPTLFIHATINGKKSVYRSINYGNSWTDIDDGTLPSNISNITGDMRDASKVYLATGGRGIIYGLAPGSVADTQAPSAPTNLQSPSKTSTSVNLTWTASTDNIGVVGYDVYIGASTTAAVSSTSTSAIVSGLTASTSYSFTVKAKDAAGNFSSPSTALPVSTNTAADTQAPSAPTNLQSPTKTSTSVNLTWTASTDNIGVVGYDVYIGSSTSAAVSSSSTSATVSGLTASTSYSFTVKAKDAAGNFSGASSTLPVTTNPPAGTTVTREYWTGVSGTTISNIPVSTTPTGTNQISSLEGPTNWADNYATRIRAYVNPTTTGAYTFYIAGDDHCELWLSTDSNPLNKVLISSVNGYTSSKQWTKYPSQKSAVKNLVANTNYYIEVLHKEGGGGDNLAVGWTGPGITSITVVSNANLVPFVASSPNLLSNSSFELSPDFTNWGKSGSTSAISTTNFQEGVKSAYVNNTYLSQNISVTGGTVYNLSMFGKTSTGTIFYGIKEYSSSWATVKDNQKWISSTSWTNGTISFTTQPNTVYADIYVWVGTGDQGYVDNFIFTKPSSGALSEVTSAALSEVTFVNPEVSFEKETVAVYPNPSNGSLNIVVTSLMNEIGTITIYDQKGLPTFTQNHNFEKGENKIYLKTSHLANGLYIIRLQLNSQQIIKKIVIHH